MAALILPSRRVVQPQGPTILRSEWRDRLIALSAPAGTLRKTGWSANDYTGSVPIGAGQLGRGFDLAATGENKVLFANADRPNTVTGRFYVVHATFKWRSTAAWGTIFGLYTGTAYVFTIGRWTNGSLRCQVGGSDVFASGARYLEDGRDYTIAMTLGGSSGQGGEVYINGVYAGKGSPTGPVSTTRAPAIGALDGTTGYEYNGLVYSAGIWDFGEARPAQADLRSLTDDPFQIYKPIERRIWVPTTSGGLTQLLSSQELNFKLRDSLSSQLDSVFKVRMFAENSLTHDYSVLNGVFKQQSVDYNLRGLITDNVELSYIIKGIVQDNLMSSYNIRSSVQDSSFIDYKVRSTCVTSEVLSYSLRTLVSLDSVFSYNINTSGQIQSSRLIQYKIRSNIQESTGFSWYIRSIETTPSGLVYNIKGNMQGSSEEFSYKIYNSASSNQEFRYKTKGLLSKEVPFSYIVLGLTQVKKDFPLLFNVLNAVQPNWTDVYIKSDSIHDVSVKSENTFVVFLK